VRAKIARQRLLRPAPLPHKLARELDHVDRLIERHPVMVELVFNDLVAHGADPSQGRNGMSAEQVLRAKVLRPRLGLSYEDLAFELAANLTYRGFCRMAPKQSWSRATLHRNLTAVRADTMERINTQIVLAGEEEGLEDTSRTRGDTTGVETHVHDPTDSSLAYVVRVLSRGMRKAPGLKATVDVVDHAKAVKRLDWRISNAKRKDQRKPHYLDLVDLTEQTITAARSVADELKEPDLPTDRGKAEALAESLRYYASLGDRVVAQTRRRVVDGESVPAKEKVLSIFEPHTDLLAKGLDRTYGHKVSLVAGTRFVFDVVVEDGNPNDSTLTKPLMDRHRERFGALPGQATFDGSFAARATFDALTADGITDLVFTKSRGIPTSETWYWLGAARAHVGELEPAREALGRCLTLARRDPEARAAAAWVCLGLDRPRDALAHTDRVLDAPLPSSRRATVYGLGASAYAALGDRAAATRAFETAVGLDPDFPRRHEVERQLAALDE